MASAFQPALHNHAVNNTEAVINARAGDSGHVVTGPYIDLPPGNYSITFHISDDNMKRGPFSTELAGIVDVCCEFGTVIIASREFSVSDLRASRGFFTLDFSVYNQSLYEFRVFTTGHIKLDVFEEQILTTEAEIDFLPLLPKQVGNHGYTYSSLDLKKHRFVLNNMRQFQNLRQLGAHIEPTAKGALVTLFGITIHVENITDFQIIGEVIIRNDYNFLANEPTCVVDIGMNVGIASLYFARLPQVREVHSFEPFKATFDRALENFQLNPQLAAKIKPNHYGLAGQTSSTVVLFDPVGSIGISTRGLDQGVPETIEVRDAADVFTSIIQGAKKNGLAVVAKIDCEGSEFPIFETLGANGLLGEISIYLIEWHKWWSVDKTQYDLINPLLDLGFVVFDHTDVENPHAGPIYAVRRPLINT